MLHLLVIAWQECSTWHQQTERLLECDKTEHGLSNHKQIAPITVKTTY